MNARQKAKQYKKQLEQLSPKYHEVFIDRTNLKHYHSRFRCFYTSGPDGLCDVERTEYEAKYKLINDILPVLKDVIKRDEDGYYTLDIWVE